MFDLITNSIIGAIIVGAMFLLLGDANAEVLVETKEAKTYSSEDKQHYIDKYYKYTNASGRTFCTYEGGLTTVNVSCSFYNTLEK